MPWNYPLQIFGRSVGAALARHPGIDHISFTGSPPTGAAVVKMAADNHVPVSLELGGKSPQIVFADADFDAALPVLVSAIVQNAGQTCSAGSRVLIERSAYEPLLKRLSEAFSALKVGPSKLDLDCGPLISSKQQQSVWDFLSDAQHDSITMTVHDEVIAEAPEAGFYQAPTLLRDVPPAHRLAREEVFGPVLCAMPFDDEAEALKLANGTDFGLVAGIWTRDSGWQMRIARPQGAFGAGVHQQLRRRRRRGIAVRRRQTFGPRPRKRLRSAVWVHGAQNHRHQAWLNGNHFAWDWRRHETARQDRDCDRRRIGIRVRDCEDICARRRESRGKRSQQRGSRARGKRDCRERRQGARYPGM
ncbi:Aldehyde dehydrogenase [Candidatus Burkholderia crenata]|nr:Aldehyde dehydrogenase [Candidatus Burkholderia crenata]